MFKYHSAYAEYEWSYWKLCNIDTYHICPFCCGNKYPFIFYSYLSLLFPAFIYLSKGKPLSVPVWFMADGWACAVHISPLIDYFQAHFWRSLFLHYFCPEGLNLPSVRIRDGEDQITFLHMKWLRQLANLCSASAFFSCYLHPVFFMYFKNNTALSWRPSDYIVSEDALITGLFQRLHDAQNTQQLYSRLHPPSLYWST